MAIDSVHPAYAEMRDDWRQMRDVLAGQRAMRRNAEHYLRRPMGMVDELEWQRYVDATDFFEATLRTQEGLVGMAFYREPEITLPDGMAAFIKDCTGDGVPLRQFLEASFEEVNAMARTGVIVEYPPADPAVVTQLDFERSGRRPYLRRYVTEHIFNWAVGKVRGVDRLTEIRLWETETEKVGEWGTRYRRRIRVLQLVQRGGRWVYIQRLFRHKAWKTIGQASSEGDLQVPVAPGTSTDGDESWVEDANEILPLKAGEALDYIPFWIINPTDQSPEMRRPPMLGLSNANVGHFRTTASLENALFWCGNPQLYITGVDADDKTVYVAGSSTAWTFKEANTTVAFASFGSDGLAPIEKRLDRIEQHMALLGARMLSPDRAGVEAAETARIHRQGEVSVLAGECGSLSRSFTDICITATEWQGLDPAAVLVKVQTAFFDEIMTTTAALDIVKLWQAGVIDVDDMLAQLKKGQFVSADRTAELIVANNQSSPIQNVMPGLTDGTGTTAPPRNPAPTE